VFIIGAPRSGSTLLYQYLSLVLQVSYTSNAWALLPRSGAYIFPGRTSPPIDFRSFYGNSGYFWGPQEGGSIFSQWFDQEEHHFVDDIPGSLKDKMRIYFEIVSAIGGQPWLIKNGRNAVRLQVLNAAFPEAAYIRIRRDPLMIAQSIIEGRMNLRNDPRKSWTVKPKEWGSIKSLPYPRQVARQVYYIEAQIEQDLVAIPSKNVLTCDYNDFCKAPFEAAHRVCERFSFVQRRPNVSPELGRMNFKVSSELRLDSDVLSQINDELAILTAMPQLGQPE
jgi:hypothetical protein